MHKFKPNDTNPKFRPIVSSLSTYNYKLTKFLCTLLSPLPSKYSCQDSFTFATQVNEVSLSNKFMVSFDVTSLFPIRGRTKLEK